MKAAIPSTRKMITRSQIRPIPHIIPRQLHHAQTSQRWSRFLRQPVKVDLTTQRTIHHEDAETIFG